MQFGAVSWHAPLERSRPSSRARRLRWALIGIGVAIYLALAFGTMDVNWGRVADGHTPRQPSLSPLSFPPDFVTRWDAHPRRHLRIAVDDRDLHRGGDRPFAIPGRPGRRAQPGTAPRSTSFAAASWRSAVRFRKSFWRSFFVKLFGFGPFAGFVTLSDRHHWLLRQAFGRGYRGHGPGPGRGGESHRRFMVPVAELFGPAPGHAAHDRPRASTASI